MAVVLAGGLCIDRVGAQDAAGELERAFDDLGDPARARAASAVLERSGAEVVPRLAAAVVPPQRYFEPRPRVLGALWVLGRLGAAARAALPAIATAAVDRDGGIADQALWALAEIGQHEDPDRRELLAAGLQGDRFAARVARCRLLLGDTPDQEPLRQDLVADAADRVIAACMQGAGRDPALRSESWRQLAAALRPIEMPWDAGPLRPAAAMLAAALVDGCGRGSTSGEPDDLRLLIGRGLLGHYDPALRKRALPLVRGLAGAGRIERAELLPLLVDGDAELRQLAAWTFQGFGRGGLMALPLLRRLQTKDGDVGVRMACGTVADELLRACADDRAALLAVADQHCRGVAAGAIALPADATSVELLAELLCGAEWVDAELVGQLLPAAPPGQVLPPTLVAAGLRLCINVDAKIRVLAAGWLARNAANTPLPELEATIDRMAAMTGVLDAEVVEMLAWVRAGRTTSPSALVAAMSHPNPRVAVRAAVEWIERGLAAAQGELDFLHRLAAPPSPLADELGAFLLGVDLDAEVRAAATLVLVVAGERSVDTAPLELLAPPGSDRTRWIADRLRGGEEPALARELETRVQRRLGIPDGVAPPR